LLKAPAAAAAALDGEFGEPDQQRLAIALAALGGVHEQVFQINSGLSEEKEDS